MTGHNSGAPNTRFGPGFGGDGALVLIDYNPFNNLSPEPTWLPSRLAPNYRQLGGNVMHDVQGRYVVDSSGTTVAQRNGRWRMRVQVYLAPTDGRTEKLKANWTLIETRYSNSRTGVGNLDYDVDLQVLPPAGAKYIIEVHAMNLATGATSETQWDGRYAFFIANRPPSAPAITSPPSGTSLQVNSGIDSLRTIEFEVDDPDALSEGTTPRALDIGGWQVQIRPAPTGNNPNPEWRQAIGYTTSGQEANWRGQMVAKYGFPVTTSTTNPEGNPHAPGFASPQFQVIASQGTPGYLVGSTPTIGLPPGGWQLRVRAFDRGFDSQSGSPAWNGMPRKLADLHPSNVSDWSPPWTVYVESNALAPVINAPANEQAASIARILLDWSFRDPRPAGGTQFARRARIRRPDGGEIPDLPPLPTPSPTIPPQGTINRLSQPRALASTATGWSSWDTTYYVVSTVTSTIPGFAGSAMRVTRQNAGAASPGTIGSIRAVGHSSVVFGGGPSVTPGQTYAFSAYTRIDGGLAGRAAVALRWFNSSNTLLSTTVGDTVVLAANATGRCFVSGVAPAGAAYCETLIEITRSTGVNAANGNSAQVTAGLLTQGSATMWDYFDGSYTSAVWLGNPGVSQSQWIAPAEDVGGGWKEIIPSPAQASALQEYEWLSTPLEPGVRYEWQARTTAIPDGIDSGWSESAFFWAVPAPGSGEVIPQPDVNEPAPGLGCGRHRVMVALRGGKKIIGEILGLEQVRWDRLRDDISSATIIAEANKGCDELLETLRPWQYEIVIFRETGAGRPRRVWEGPITRLTFRAESIEIAARDPMIYVYRRILRQGFNDSYVVKGRRYGQNPSNPNGPGIIIDPGKVISQPISVVVRAGRIIQNALAYDDPNVLPYLRVMSQADDAKQSRIMPDYSATAWQVIDDFAARSGLDYTTVGRAILLWDTHRGIGRLPEMSNGDFDSDPIITEYGMLAANHYGVTNGSGVYGFAEKVDSAGRPLYYGWLEMLNSAYGEDGEAGSDETLTAEARAKLVEAFTDQARRNIQDRLPAPIVVRVPDNSTLNPGVDIDINQLVPGVYIPLRASGVIREFTQVQKLDAVKVVETAEGEVVQVTLSPSYADDANPAGEE